MAAVLSAGERRVHRCVWLAVRLSKRGEVDFRGYNRRFGASERSYYRDLGTLGRIGIEVRSVRDHGHVRLVRERL